jgi:hypothetical protein
MRLALLSLFLLALIAAVAHANVLILAGAASGGGCSNALDFSQACNSQYIGVM